jgi:predicted nucleotidyltransferase
MNNFGLTEEHVHILKKYICNSLAPNQKIKVWIFGSRARGNHRPFSDVDLLLEAAPMLQENQINNLKENLENSNIPFKFDLVIPQELYTPYAEQIKKEKKLIFVLP